MLNMLKAKRTQYAEAGGSICQGQEDSLCGFKSILAIIVEVKTLGPLLPRPQCATPPPIFLCLSVNFVSFDKNHLLVVNLLVVSSKKVNFTFFIFLSVFIFLKVA